MLLESFNMLRKSSITEEYFSRNDISAYLEPFNHMIDEGANSKGLKFNLNDQNIQKKADSNMKQDCWRTYKQTAFSID